jgi:GDP-L-fucose synthase
MAAANYALAGKRVYVAGHRGMVGGALARRLSSEKCIILIADRVDLDLRNQASVNAWFAAHRPHAVFLAAAKVGGIHANNTYRAEFIYDNLAIAVNIIHAAYTHAAEKLMFLGSSCIYPRLARQPILEGQLLQGPLEATRPYATKIAGLFVRLPRQYGADFTSVMPSNLMVPVTTIIPRIAMCRGANSPISRAEN